MFLSSWEVCVYYHQSQILNSFVCVCVCVCVCSVHPTSEVTTTGVQLETRMFGEAA